MHHGTVVEKLQLIVEQFNMRVRQLFQFKFVGAEVNLRAAIHDRHELVADLPIAHEDSSLESVVYTTGRLNLAIVKIQVEQRYDAAVAQLAKRQHVQRILLRYGFLLSLRHSHSPVIAEPFHAHSLPGARVPTLHPATCAEEASHHLPPLRSTTTQHLPTGSWRSPASRQMRT